MGYSTLLNRSVDWEGEYAVVYQTAYPDAIDQQLGYALIQMLWDRGESSGYAQHMTDDPLPNTPSHEVFLQVAFADHQVANVAAEVKGRTIGASLVTPSLAPGRHWSVDPAFGFRTISGSQPDAGSRPRLLVRGGHRPAGPAERQPAPSARARTRTARRGPTARRPTRSAAWLLDGRLRRRVQRRALHDPPARP